MRRLLPHQPLQAQLLHSRKALSVLAILPLILLAVTVGLTIKPNSKASGPVAPSTPTAVCGTSILNSPYSYNGAPGTFNTSGTPSGLPTFGAAGTAFPAQNQLVVIPAGNNKAAASTGAYADQNTVYYFEPGSHFIDFMYAGHDNVYIGGYTAAAGKAVLDGVDGATGGTGKGGNRLVVSTPSSGNNVYDTWEYLTIQNYSSNQNNSVMGNVNGGDTDNGDTYKYNTIGPNQFSYLGDSVAPGTGQSSGGGYAIDAGDNTTIQYNCLMQNPQGAFNGGGENITITNNEIARNGIGEYPDTGGAGASPYACGCSGGGKLFYSNNATINYNYIHDNYNVGIWLDFDNAGADMSFNYIANNWSSAIEYEASYNANITYNTMVGNGWASNGAWPAGYNNQPCAGTVSCTNGNGPVTGGPWGNPMGAIDLSNSGGNPNLTTIKLPDGSTTPARYSGTINVIGNNLVNNFGGVKVYSDTDRYPDGVNNDSSCSMPLAPLVTQHNNTYYRQTKFLVVGGDAGISGSSVSSSSGTETLCNAYGTQQAVDGQQDIHSQAPEVGMAVYDEDANTFLGNIASVTSAHAFALDRSPGNRTGASLVISAYGGCGPADYFGGAHNVATGTPSANYWDNCNWGSRNIAVTGNTFTMDAGTVTGCTTANGCGFQMAEVFLAGVAPLDRYFQTMNGLVANATGGLGNVWSNNAYYWTGGGSGSWQYWAGDQSHAVTQAAWRAAPYNQDAGSTYGTTPSVTPTPSATPTPSTTPSTTPSPTPTPTPSGKIGDLNNDNAVNIFDLSILLSAWNTANATADINHDSTVNIFDLSILLSHWGT